MRVLPDVRDGAGLIQQTEDGVEPRPSNQCPGEVTPRRSRPLEGQSNTLASFDYRATMPRLASGKRFNGFRFFLESRPDHNPPFVSSTFIAAL